MKIVNTAAELRMQTAQWRRQESRIGLVPTMGNLHEGHISLARRCAVCCDKRVASIFVNPLQFGPNEDFDSYPRTLEADAAKLEQAGIDLVFSPSAREVYPRGLDENTRVEVPGITEVLCGASRPGHFTGVATVVTKLMNLVTPDWAIFGEKDWQQLLVIRRALEDLNIPVEVEGAPIIREADGLAMSSRNGFLSAEEREKAPLLNKIMIETVEKIKAGDVDFAKLEKVAISEIVEAGFKPDYFKILTGDGLTSPLPTSKNLRIFAAAWLGKPRLIDNIPVGTP